ncbi:hypothetical protein ACGFMK_47285 [Amycolatopsis sp. NPDC049252]|uniref:hypothetical protein n=1 Tax=Amycolatopsis sp. NPDC049252 TaxID=3363933 RepID=UPI0037152D50
MVPSRYRLAGYLTGATLARTGDELSGPALLLLGLTAGPGAGSALLAGLTAAAAAGGPVFGALLDRSPAPGRLLAVALAGYAAGIALVTVVFGHLPLWSVVAMAVLTGLLNPAIAGGWTAQLPAVVSGGRLPSAAGRRRRSIARHERDQPSPVVDGEPDRSPSAASGGSCSIARRERDQLPSIVDGGAGQLPSATSGGARSNTRHEQDQPPPVVDGGAGQLPSATSGGARSNTRHEQDQPPSIVDGGAGQLPSATSGGARSNTRHERRQPPSIAGGEPGQLPSAVSSGSCGLPQPTSTTGDRPPHPPLATGEPPAQSPSAAGTAAADTPAPPIATASRLDAMTFTAAALAGPGLAGLLANLAGAPSALAVAVAMVAAALPVAWKLPGRPRPKAARLKEQLNSGFRVLLRNAPLRRATVTSTLSCAGIGMVTVCYPLLGAAHLGGAANGALLMTVLAVASLLANAVFTGKTGTPDTVVWASTLVLAASCALAAAATGPALLIAAATLAGFAEGPQLTALFAIRHRETPERVRAQVFTTAASVKITGLALGAAVAGPLSAAGTGTCLIAAAAVQLLAASTQVRRPSPGRAASPRCRGSCATR